jgi:hypothetical protein
VFASLRTAEIPPFGLFSSSAGNGSTRAGTDSTAAGTGGVTTSGRGATTEVARPASTFTVVCSISIRVRRRRKIMWLLGQATDNGVETPKKTLQSQFKTPNFVIRKRKIGQTMYCLAGL